MRNILLLVAALSATAALANGPWEIKQQNVKFPSQVMLEHKKWTTPAAASTTLLKTAQAVSSATATTVSSFSAQPDFARNVVLTPGGTTASFASGTAVVSGLNIYGKAITENFSIGNAQSATLTGSKAFASVTSVVIPIASGAGATMSIGSGTKLGVQWCATDAGDYVFSKFNGAYEGTRGTFAVSATAIESNTFIPNGSPDGAKDVDVYFVQNFRCYGGL